MMDGDSGESVPLPSVKPELASVAYRNAHDAESAVKAAVAAPGTFTEDHDQALDELEGTLFNEVFSALAIIRPDDAESALQTITALREAYIELMDKIQEDTAHPLHGSASGLRRYAMVMKSQAAHLEHLRSAFDLYRKGEGTQAIQVLDRLNIDGVERIPGAEFVQNLFVVTTKVTAELLAAQLRQSVGDFAGARAAYSRAVSVCEAALADIDREFEAAIRYQQTIAESGALRMQLAQLQQQHDYVNAAEIAQSCAEKLVAASEQMAEDEDILPAGLLAIVAFLRAGAQETYASAEAARAEVALEHWDWQSAEDRAGAAARCYEVAASEVLKCGIPVARLAQERLLNRAFELTVQFRRRLDRERQARERTLALETELKDLYSDLRGAFAPTGVTINNQADLVNEVQQHVELINHIEAGARQSLRDLPKALENAGIPDAEALATEALEIADLPAGATFRDRVKKFTHRLNMAITGVGALAEPVVAILKALQILP